MTYGGGIAVGAGPMIRMTKGLPLHQHITPGLETLAAHIRAGEAMHNYYARTRSPRLVYHHAAHISFRRPLKKPGNPKS